MARKPSVKLVTATEAKNHFGDIIKGAYLRDEHLIVKRDGIPVVAIVSIAEYARLVGLDHVAAEEASLLALSRQEGDARARLAQFLAEVHAQMPVTAEEEAEEDVAAAVEAARRSA